MSLIRNPSSKMQLHNVCCTCRAVRLHFKAPHAVIGGYLDELPKDTALSCFVYALACDYFATMTEEPSFIERAKIAYRQAMAVYDDQAKRMEFLQVQAYYQETMRRMEDAYKVKLFEFLEIIVLDDRQSKPLPSLQVCFQVFQELNDNLLLLEPDIRRHAVMLIEYAQTVAQKELNITDTNIGDIYELKYRAGILFYAMNGRGLDTFGEAHHLAMRLSQLSLNDEESADNPLRNLWLVRALLKCDNIPEFISALINGLSLLMPRHGVKRSLADMEQDPMDTTAAFERRIVRVQRRTARVPMVPVGDIEEPLEDRVVEPPKEKRARF